MSEQKPSTVVIGYSSCAKVAMQLLNKEGIASLYRLIQQSEPITLDRLTQLSKQPEWAVRPIIRIFDELNLIQIEAEHIRLRKTEEKRNLAESDTYKGIMKVREQYDFLSNESLQTIKKYITNLMEA